MKRFIFKTLVYCIILGLIVNVFSWVSLLILKNADLYKPSYILKHLEPEASFDYVVLGSSTGLTGIDTEQLDSLLHLKGYNLSLDGMAYGGQRMMLEHFITHHYQTKYCFLSVDVNNISKPTSEISMNEFYFLPFLNKDYVYNSFYHREKGLKFRAFTRYVPVLGCAYYNQEIFFSSMLALLSPHRRHHFNEKGNEAYRGDDIVPSGEEYTELKFEFSNEDVLAIEKLCEDNNIQLIYIIPPKYHTKIMPRQTDGRKLYNFSTLINDEKMFHDSVHVNVYGRTIYTKALADTLSKYNL